VAAEIPPHILASGIFGELTLGHFYSIVTWLLGFAPVSDEGKVEALAAYGTAENPLLDAMRKTVRLVSDPPRLEVDREAACALFLDLPRLRRFVAELGREQVAAATQRFLEEQVIALVRALLTRYPRSTLVLSGGCAANVVLNMRLFEEVCPDLYVVPAMADDGTALGAAALALSEGGAALADFGFLGPRTLPYFGDAVPRSEVLRVLTAASARIRFEDRSADWPEEVADRLMRGEIGALFHGRMEWGPRALGHRSIVANPCRDDARDRLNAVVKRRPLFQPFCPAILAEERDRLFAAAYDDRHMTCAFRMREEFHAQLPGAIHVDGTARAQFVHAEDDPEFHRMLTAFRRSSGFGVVINTSFNLHGRTIVRTAEDALDDFLDSRMEFLVIEGYLVLPIDQRSRAA
jgi:carbamoyltransferase